MCINWYLQPLHTFFIPINYYLSDLHLPYFFSPMLASIPRSILVLVFLAFFISLGILLKKSLFWGCILIFSWCTHTIEVGFKFPDWCNFVFFLLILCNYIVLSRIIFLFYPDCRFVLNVLGKVFLRLVIIYIYIYI